MQTEILKLINGPEGLEPITTLESYYRKIQSGDQKKNFVDSLKAIAQVGSIKEKFAALTLIQMLNKAYESKDLIIDTIDNLNYKDDLILIIPLLWLAAEIQSERAVKFIKEIIIMYSPDRNGAVYTNALRSFTTTSHWTSIKDELATMIKELDDHVVVDYLAFFKWKRSKNDWTILRGLFDVNIQTKIANLESKVNERYKNHYLAVG